MIFTEPNTTKFQQPKPSYLPVSRTVISRPNISHTVCKLTTAESSVGMFTSIGSKEFSNVQYQIVRKFQQTNIENRLTQNFQIRLLATGMFQRTRFSIFLDIGLNLERQARDARGQLKTSQRKSNAKSRVFQFF